MSLNDIKNINSKVVISLHDMWFLRSTEHYSLNNEPLLRDKVSDYCQKKKKEIVKQANVFFIAHNQWMLSQFNKTYPGNKNKIFLCENYPINTNIFKPRNKKNLRKKYNIPIKKKIIFFSAQDTSDFRKGYNHFINVVEKLKNEKNILFISVGRHRKDLDTIKNLKQIDFLSHDKICEIYSLSDIFVCTSVIDNLPLTVLEALASGNVVFSFKNGGANKILDKVGFSYDLNKKNQLINDLKKISLPQIRSKSYKSRSFALKNFNYQSISSQYNKIFKKII
jgi:glycogen synthase